MQSIKIFVASSIVAFGAERRSIAALFCELNNQLINDGIFYNVHFCEELDNAVSESRKQDEYNTYIANGDTVFFVVDSDCGDYTFEEFDIALNSANKPRIIVFAQYSEKTLGEHVKYMKQKSEEGRAKFICFRDFSYVETRINAIVAEQTAELKIANPYAQPDYLKKVSFFLGTALNENQQEKNGILRFALSLNEKLLSEGIYAQIVPCIEISDDINSEKMIARHKELIIWKWRSLYSLKKWMIYPIGIYCMHWMYLKIVSSQRFTHIFS